METINIWNKKVNYCSECPLFHWDDYGYGNCTEIDLSIDTKESKEIDKDCPFKQPITKEQIESLGFKKCDTLKGYYYKKHPEVTSHSGEYFLNDSLVDYDSYELFVAQDEEIWIMDLDGRHRFIGYLNNIEELKFILNRIGVL